VSRIGRMPIAVPAGVEVKLDGHEVSVKGPKGALTQSFSPEIGIALEKSTLSVTRESDEPRLRSLHGLTRALLANMVHGVTDGFTRTLEINGVGYRAQKQGSTLVMNLGYSHQVVVAETDTIKIAVPAPNQIVISGPDKQAVGQFAADVRAKRPPEPYKGKGIKYAEEHIRRKEGKAGKGAKK